MKTIKWDENRKRKCFFLVDKKYSSVERFFKNLSAT